MSPTHLLHLEGETLWQLELKDDSLIKATDDEYRENSKAEVHLTIRQLVPRLAFML